MSEIKFEDLITFHPDSQVMEVDFSNVMFDVSATVHSAYDNIDRQLENTKSKWFFLVNYRDCRVMSEAWITFAHRGKITNLSYSLGSARFAVRDDIGEEILQSAKEENFDPNLFHTRDEALAHLAQIRSKIAKEDFEQELTPTPPIPVKSLAERIVFHTDEQIVEVDFSDHTFATSADVNLFYDEIAAQIAATQKKWYFLVNYAKTEILPEAWYNWAIRGGEVNKAHSLGTVRFDPQEKTREDIQKRARNDDFNPNLVSTRDEALARIDELKQE